MKSILGNRYGPGVSFFLSLFVVMATCVLLCITLYYEINIGGSLWAGSFFQSEPKVPHPLQTHVSDLVRHSLCWFVLFNKTETSDGSKRLSAVKYYKAFSTPMETIKENVPEFSETI